MGGFGCIFKGEYQGVQIALKVLYKKCRGSDSIARDFCREALAWRSLSHPHILPLLGIYKAESQLFLVSPYMKNGTLASWRKNNQQSVHEVRQRILEVAEGVQYIHSEGIVHGDLRGENILLDAYFRSQITDFGLTRHSDITITSSDTALTLGFAAPELFGVCSQCGQRECNGCSAYGIQKRRKTLQTDVYSFGCLYYEIFFDAMPFANMGEYQVILRVMNGERPNRLAQPWMSDPEWNMVQHCWIPNSFGRPDMNYVVEAMRKNPGGDISRTVPSAVGTRHGTPWSALAG
ncbi:kinase-like domain-containing protein [Amanita rubescens]|nr:kinase-like domain-containing protein [Amanita rubescens]